MANSVNTFRYRSVVRASVEDVMRFHSAPRALQTLTPPPIFVQVIRDERVSLVQGEIVFRLWFGPLPVLWIARHAPGPTPTSFVDCMVSGPMAQWEHEHRFRPVGRGAELMDTIRYAHKPGWRGVLTRIAFGSVALRMLFWYRHWRTRRSLNGVVSGSRNA